ncbi:AVAST type 1 anti-phage system MBL fold metallo-hydrolase Avs1a [Flavobacterium sp. WG21]|uniref:AVAST type 1 anti-phage system MBL fold metallo-hydrolase Avs1a n=1 Tax=Flavobacterium sp. WG21 TaxID=1229487 RepID=UPI00034A31C4|nr:AVAST type 1 anti-phage system MBL fold metallo-hydrolase Avs1a [Flavobacterium sp. WG21]
MTSMDENNLIVRILPASNGDCFLISFDKKNILLDGGYVSTYKNCIKPILVDLEAKGEKVDYLIVSHIDSDHISGIIKLLEENNSDPFIKIDNIWHNSYRHLQNIGGHNHFFLGTHSKKIEELKISSILKDDSIESEKNISAKKGSTLAALILNGGYNWNSQFNNGPCINNTDIIADPFHFKILSPNKVRLEKLKNYWAKELYKLGFINDLNSTEYFDDAFEFIISKEKEPKFSKSKNISSVKIDMEELALLDFDEDATVANGSSISFILETFGKKMLFLADSHPSVIIDNLKSAYTSDQFPIHFDLIKISHHGSVLNSSKELLSLIDSDKYIISTNGKSFNHPDIETIARIVTRNCDFVRSLYFNYEIPLLKTINDSTLKDKYKYECIVAQENIKIK